MAKLNDFHENTTKRFDVVISYNGSTPNISNDTVSIVFKTVKGGTTVISKDADVATNGANGTAEFTLTTTDTDVAHGKYYYQITWELNSGEFFVIDDGSISILERV